MANVDRSYVDISANGSRLVQGPVDVISPKAINLRYPNGPGGMLGQRPYEKWILFEARSGRHILRNTITPEAGTIDRTLASVALFLPEGALSSDMSVRYADSPLGDIAGPLLEAAIQGRKTYEEFAATNTNNEAPAMGISKDGAIAKILETGKNIGASTLSALAARVANSVKSGLERAVTGGGDAAELLAGASVNPRTDLLFKSVEYRTHTLTWTLVPRTKQEADTIDKLVSFFQYYMLPSYGNPTSRLPFLIGYPYEFEVRMFSEFDDLSHHHINSIGRSVIRNVSVTNSTDGRVAFIESNGEYYPVSTTLRVDLQEVRLLGRDSAEIVRGGVNNFEDPRVKA